jgi:L-malate glycosyltransferase
MKIVLFSPGKSSHTHKWAMYFIEHGIDVTVVTFKDHYSKENAKEVTTLVLPKILPGKLSYLPAVLALRKILAELKPDILHAHFVSSYGFVGALANYHPFFVSVWGTDIYKFPKRSSLNRRIVEFTLGKAEVVCSTSKTMALETAKYTNKNIKVTPFGVDLSLFSSKQHVNKGKLVVGIAKGLDDIYGFRDLFRAFAILKPKFESLELHILGDGPMRGDYEELTRELEIVDKVQFIGRVPNTMVPQYMKEMDIVAMPSYEDSFGVTAVEAMACGIPVVVSDVDGLKEVVLENETGLIVPRGNPEELAQALGRLLKDEELRLKMGRRGIEHVRQNYDWNDNADYMVKLYKDTIGTRMNQ